jgi:asparagine synthase (glutamine-hydrolysing)
VSGIFGCLNLDGAPVDRALLGRMQNRLAHRGPDGAAQWVDGAVGLGHLALHTTPESVRERQPLLDASGALCLTLDGRVDNRDELLADLRAKGFEPRDDTDAELVLQAYRCWGEESPARIIGDFAFAIWDGAAGRLFCARDIAGVRQLYYFRDARRFLWASEWRALFEHAAVSRAPDERMIAQHLCNTLTGNGETLFRDIARLPPGHALAVTRDGLRLRRYWDVDPRRAIRYRNDDDYAEHFHAIFREAVRCRLRSQRPVAADLSGGIDSSSIVGMVEALRAEGAVTLPGFETFSLAFPGLACDERPYVDAVARRWNLAPHFSEAAVLDRGFYETQVRADFSLPQVPNGTMSEPMRRLEVARGMRVVLDGSGGDEWFTGGYYHFADLLRQGRLLALVRQARNDAKVTAFEYSPAYVFRHALWPLLPLGLRMALRRLLRREGARAFITPDFARHLPSPEELCREPVLGGCVSFDQAEMYALLHSADSQRDNEEIDRCYARQGIEVRSPFMDRRLIEFAFALPEDQRWRGGRTKYVLRRAMRRLLPETVAARTGKAEFSHIVVETLRSPSVNFRFEHSTLESLGWVRGAEVRRIYSEMLFRYNACDPGYGAFVWPAWGLFGVETWMNEVVLQR